MRTSVFEVGARTVALVDGLSQSIKQAAEITIVATANRIDPGSGCEEWLQSGSGRVEPAQAALVCGCISPLASAAGLAHPPQAHVPEADSWTPVPNVPTANGQRRGIKPPRAMDRINERI